MHIRRFLENIARTSLAIGVLATSAFAGANQYPFYNEGGWGQDFNGGFGCCEQQGCCESAPVCNWGYNPPAYLNCGEGCNGGGFLDTLRFRADFLWWRASEEGLALGTENTINETSVFNEDTDVTTTTLINSTHVKKPNFKYDPGFRLGLMSICPCDCWDVAFNWTHFHTKARVSGASLNLPIFEDEGLVAKNASKVSAPVSAKQLEIETDNFTAFIPAWERFDGNIPDAAHARWSLDMDLFDLEFGSKYYVCHCLSLRPHIGLRGARINQTYQAFSFASTDTGDETRFTDFYTSDVRSKCRFLGVGPRVGIDVSLSCGCGIGIFGQAAGSLLFGKIDRHSRELYNDSEDLITNTYYTRGSPERVSRAITDFAIGLEWNHCVCWCNRQHPLSIVAAWEHHAFWDFNNFDFGNDGIATENDSDFFPVQKKHGDLYTQGLTLSFNVGF